MSVPSSCESPPCIPINPAPGTGHDVHAQPLCQYRSSIYGDGPCRVVTLPWVAPRWLPSAHECRTARPWISSAVIRMHCTLVPQLTPVAVSHIACCAPPATYHAAALRAGAPTVQGVRAVHCPLLILGALDLPRRCRRQLGAKEPMPAVSEMLLLPTHQPAPLHLHVDIGDSILGEQPGSSGFRRHEPIASVRWSCRCAGRFRSCPGVSPHRSPAYPPWSRGQLAHTPRAVPAELERS